MNDGYPLITLKMAQLSSSSNLEEFLNWKLRLFLVTSRARGTANNLCGNFAMKNKHHWILVGFVWCHFGLVSITPLSLNNKYLYQQEFPTGNLAENSLTFTGAVWIQEMFLVYWKIIGNSSKGFNISV